MIKNGKVVDVIKRRKNANPLPPSQAKQAEEFVWARKEQILKKWIEVLVEKKKIPMETITRRVN